MAGASSPSFMDMEISISYTFVGHVILRSFFFFFNHLKNVKTISGIQTISCQPCTRT